MPGANNRINSPNSRAILPIFEAIEYNSAPYLRKLLENRQILVNVKPSGETPLCLAAKKAQTSLVRLLINHPSTNPNIPDELEGNTPLHIAAQSGDATTLKCLLSHPAITVNARNNAGKTPLQLALETLTNAPREKKEQIKQCVEQFLEYNNPLHIAAQNGDVATLESLLSHHAASIIDAKNNAGKTALILALEAQTGASEEKKKQIQKCIARLIECDAELPLPLLATLMSDKNTQPEDIVLFFKQPACHKTLKECGRSHLFSFLSENNLLYYAVNTNDYILAAILIKEFDMDPLAPNMHGNMPIKIIRDKYPTELNNYLALLQNKFKGSDFSLYYWAVIADLAGIREYLEKNAPLPSPSQNWSPAEVALLLGNTTLALLLIDHMAPADVDNLLLRLSVMTGQLGRLAHLAQRGVRLDSPKMTIFFVEMLIHSIEYNASLYPQIARLINVNCSSDEISPLTVAIRSKNSLWIQILLDAGANPLRQPQQEYSPTYYSLLYDETGEIFRKFFSQLPLNEQETPTGGLIAAACSKKMFSCAQELLQSGLNVNYTDHYGNSPLFYAIVFGQITLAQTLLRQGVSPSLDGAFVEAVKLGNDALIHDFLELKDLNIDKLNVKGCSALYYAVKSGNYDLVSILLEKGANPNHCGTNTGKLPLVAALKKRDKKIIDLLLTRGANSNSRETIPFVGQTPLMAAIDASLATNDPYFFTRLIEHGADPHFSNAHGMTGRIYYDITLKKNTPIYTLLDKALKPQEDYRIAFHAKVYADNVLGYVNHFNHLVQYPSYIWEKYTLDSTFFWSHHYVKDVAFGWSEFCKKHNLYAKSAERTAQALLRSDHSEEQIKAFFETGEPIFCFCHWNRHALSVSIYRDASHPKTSYFMIINGGPRLTDLQQKKAIVPAVHVFAIPSNLVTVDLLEELKNHTNFSRKKEGINYFYAQIPTKLHGESNKTTKALEKQLACKQQNMGNCSYYCVQKATFRATLYLETNGHSMKSEIKKMNNAFRIWQLSFKTHALQKFKNLAQSKPHFYQSKYFMDGQTELLRQRQKLDETLAKQMGLSGFLASVSHEIEAIETLKG